MQQEITINELLTIVGKNKLKILLAPLIGAVVVFIILLFVPNWYVAGCTMTPVEEAKGGGLSALAERFGGLAGLAGVNIASGDGGKVNIALEVLESKAFILFFIKKNKLTIPLMAGNGWDNPTGDISIDKSKYDLDSGTWTRKVFKPYKSIPSDWEVYEEFMDRLTIKYEKDTGILRLAMKSRSPVMAKKWLEAFVSDLNSYLKAVDVREASENISFLEDQLSKTNIDEMKKIFYELIQEQTKVIMLAETRGEYMFRTLDPPLEPIEHFQPKRALISIMSGFFMAVVIFCVCAILFYRK